MFRSSSRLAMLAKAPSTAEDKVVRSTSKKSDSSLEASGASPTERRSRRERMQFLFQGRLHLWSTTKIRLRDRPRKKPIPWPVATKQLVFKNAKRSPSFSVSWPNQVEAVVGSKCLMHLQEPARWKILKFDQVIMFSSHIIRISKEVPVRLRINWIYCQ